MGLLRVLEDIDWFYNGLKIRQNDFQWCYWIYIYKYQQEVFGWLLVSILMVEWSEEWDVGIYICWSLDKDIQSIIVYVFNGMEQI